MQNLNQSRLVTGVFPRFSQIACFSSSSHWGPDRPLWLLLFRFNDSWSKCALSQSSVCNSLVTWLAYPGCTTSRWSSPRLITQEAKQTCACALSSQDALYQSLHPSRHFRSQVWPMSKFSSQHYFLFIQNGDEKKNNIKPRDMNWSNTRFCLLVSKEMLARQRRKRHRNCSVSVITFFSSHLNIVWLHQSSPLPRSSSLTERSWVKWAACNCWSSASWK